MSQFKFPDGAEFLGEDNGIVSFSVSIPVDEDGYLGRECPKCEQLFRINADDYAALPEETNLLCTYCGHHTEHSEFLTQQQLERVQRPGVDYADQLFNETLRSAFGGMRRSRKTGVSVTYRSKPFFPQPLPGIDEERMIRARTCDRCGLHYAVFGEHRFCPSCGMLSPLQIALEALDAEAVRLDALNDLPEESKADLRETGVLDRTYVDTVKNIVSIIETLAEKIFHSTAPQPEVAVKGKGQVFQRLDDFADLFESELEVDLRVDLGPAWTRLRETWAARHVYTHNDGIIDRKYTEAVDNRDYRLGERLRVDLTYCRTALKDAQALSLSIAQVADSQP